MSDPTLPLIDGSYGKPRTYDLPGQCLTCGQRFNVRRCKGDKPPLSVDCPNCECTEYSWRDLNAILAQPAAPAEGLREAVTVMDRHYGSELVARYPFGWSRVRAAIAAPAEGLREDVLAHFIDGWLAEESPEVWSWTTEKIGRRLARDWVALAATPPGDAQPEAGR